ncbi:MAG: TspO/MBR family protein, partial [Candidatus Zixiibacteriota bacterium]
PGWIFPPVWTALYIMMGVALWLVWKKGGFNKARIPIVVFFIQLLLNGLWSLFFFGLENPGLALVDIVLLWAMILVTMILFQRRNKSAGFLLLPYFLWVSFASVLNFTIWRMNA